MNLPKRIVVVGTSSSGKSTLARRLSSELGVPHVELDALYWDPGWRGVSVSRFRERTLAATAGDAWIIDGNYTRVRDIFWARAEMVVWLDYPFYLVFARGLWRTIRRLLTREELWNGNRESISTSFFSRESILVWILKTHSKKKRDYPLLFSQPQSSHLRVEILRTPADEARLLRTLKHQNS